VLLTGDFEVFGIPKGKKEQMRAGKESRVLTKSTREGSVSSMWEVQVWRWGDPAGELF